MQTPGYLNSLIKSYQKNANAKLSIQMKKYMKGQYEYFGITSPRRRELYRNHWQKYGLIPIDEIEEIVKWCWAAPQREYQYFAIETLSKISKKAGRERIQIYEFVITNKSWWDTVDYIAANLVGEYFKIYPEEIAGKTAKWMESGNIWLQRTCLLSQLKYKAATNTGLLEKFIKPLTSSNDFFIRKAIGWILREYSKTNPEYVKRFVKEHRLSGLSEREALKWINKRKSNL
jgi:3-methyladenine DNA glycosylase AlkD